MSTTVFDFLLIGRFGYLPSHDTTSVSGNEGVVISRADGGAYGIYRVEFNIRVPGAGMATGATKTIDDWLSFVRTVQGPYDTFLWKEPLVEFMYKVFTTDTDGQIGTGGSGITDFNLAHTQIDASTLKVYKAGALQTLTTHYTLVNNNTDQPLVRFVVAPTSGQAITVEYEFYYPVRFRQDPALGEFMGANEDFRMSLQIEEDYAGAHRSG